MPEKKADDEADRAYLRAVAERDKKLTAAKQLARDLNKTYADWFYVVDQEIIKSLIPALTVKPAEKAQETPPPAAPENPEAKPEESPNGASS